jgi:hypothetical protein
MQHGAPLYYPSCSPPLYGGNLTMGTPDANGAGARFTGSVIFKTIAGNPSTPANEADVRVTATLTDVRCVSALDPEFGNPTPCTADLGDYTGELQGYPSVEITDMQNGQNQNKSGTMQPLLFPFPIACAATSDTSIGATCNASTTFDAILPGSVLEGKRAIWAFRKMDVRDGGTDGVASTTDDNLPFVTQGIFVP